MVLILRADVLTLGGVSLTGVFQKIAVKKKEWVSPLLIFKVKQFFWRNAQHLAQFENHIKGNTDIA